jgi:hypothetical protein
MFHFLLCYEKKVQFLQGGESNIFPLVCCVSLKAFLRWCTAIRGLSACHCFSRHPARLSCPPGCILGSGSVDWTPTYSVRRKMLISSLDCWMDGDFKGREWLFLQFADQLHPAHPCSQSGVQGYGNLHFHCGKKLMTTCSVYYFLEWVTKRNSYPWKNITFD